MASKKKKRKKTEMSKREGESKREKGRERERVTLHSLSNTVLIIYFCRRRVMGEGREGSELQLEGNVCLCGCVCLWRGGGLGVGG